MALAMLSILFISWLHNCMHVILYANPVEDVRMNMATHQLIVIVYVNYVGPVILHHMIERLWDFHPDKISYFINLAALPYDF
jgi:hypothetical protein